MTLPPLNVWITHDGSAECPLPVGTVHDWGHLWDDTIFQNRTVQTAERWGEVTRYRVTSYPHETNEE